MYLSFVSSIILHIAIAIIGFYGIPYLDFSKKNNEEVIWVELSNITDERNYPPEKKVKKIVEKPKPVSIPKVAAAPPLGPKEEPIDVSAPISEPKIEEKVEPVAEPSSNLKSVSKTPSKVAPRPIAKLKKDKKSNSEKQQAPKPRLHQIKSRRKPKVQNDLTKIMKTLEKLKNTAKNQDKNKKRKRESEEFIKKISEALASTPKTHDSQLPVSMTDLDRVRQQIRACWNPPPGQANAEEMMIELALVMNSDGTVRTAKVSNTSRLSTDPVFRAAADAARRAVLNPKCNPLKLPLEKYSQWQKLLLSFNPRDMY